MRRILQGSGRLLSYPLPRPALLANRLHLRASSSNVSDKGEDLVLRPAAGAHNSPQPAKFDMIENEAKIEALEEQRRARAARHGDNTAAVHIEEIQDCYLKYGHKSWGWSVYRTYYDNDEQWNVFKSKFRAILLGDLWEYFPAEEAEERSKYINFPFLEDRARFEGASKAQLRNHYLAYRNSDAVFEEQGLPALTGEARREYFFTSFCRYDWFLVADAAAIASVVNAPKDLRGWLHETTPWITVVQVDWTPEVEDEFGEQPDNGHELVEGSDLYDVGFHRLALQTLYPGHWGTISLGDSDDYYERPPAVVWQHGSRSMWHLNGRVE